MVHIGPVTKMLVPGPLTRPEDDWCTDCSKPGLWAGKAYMLTMDGIGLWGSVHGCADCNNWIWLNLKGEQHEVTDIID